MAEEPGELDGEGGPEVGVDGLGTVRDGHGLRDEAGASRHLRMEGRRGRQDTVRQLVPVGPGDAGKNRRTAQADGPSGPDDRESFGGDPDSLGSRADNRLHGGTQQPVISREAQGPWVPDGGVHDNHALLCRRETHPTVLLTH